MSEIGDVISPVSLTIFTNADLNADVEWFESDGVTAIDISAFQAQILDFFGGTVLLDLSIYTEMSANTLLIAVPKAITATLVPGSAVWQIQATATDSGETKVLIRGSVSIEAGLMPSV
jgi:hypothetical protein